MLRVLPVPAFKDNYIWLIIHNSSPSCLIIDPGEAQPVLAILQEQSLQPTGILLTHHHWDHVNGVAELQQHYSLRVFGPAQETIETVTDPVQAGDNLTWPGWDLELRVMAIPGHTRGHVAYTGDGMLFCGDTLFTGGCGRLFEGTAEQMYHSLQALAGLPEETSVYCGHEYTEANLRFAQAVEPDNQDLLLRIKQTAMLRAQQLPTVPSSLALEKQTNPFLRCHLDSVRQAAEKHAATSLHDPVAVFRTIRAWKDNF